MRIIEPKLKTTPSTAVMKEGWASNWNRLKTVQSISNTVAGAQEQSGVNWSLSKRPVVYQTGRHGIQVAIPDSYVLTNSLYGSVHSGIISGNYKHDQPAELIERGLKTADILGMEPVMIGYEGGSVYMILDCNKDWTLDNPDEPGSNVISLGGGIVRSNSSNRKLVLTLTYGIDGRTGSGALFSDTNVFCNNQVPAMLVNAQRSFLRYSHVGDVASKKEKFWEVIYGGIEKFEEEKELKKKLASEKVDYKDALEILIETFNLQEKLVENKVPQNILNVVTRFKSSSKTKEAGGFGNGSMHDLLECFTYENMNVRSSRKGDASKVLRNFSGNLSAENGKLYNALLKRVA